MVRITALIFLLIVIFGCANSGPRNALNNNEGQWEYVETHSTTKDSAFAQTIEWISINFKSAKTVIQFQDKESGKLVLKGLEPFTNMYRTDYCNYTLTISIKDQKMRFRYELGEIVKESGGGFPATSEMSIIEKSFISTKDSIIESIKKNKSDDF